MVHLRVFLDALAVVLRFCKTKFDLCGIIHLLHRLLRLLLMESVWIQLEILYLSLESFWQVSRCTQMTYVRESHLASSLVNENISIVQILVTKAEIILIASRTVFLKTYRICVRYGRMCLVCICQSRIGYCFE